MKKILLALGFLLVVLTARAQSMQFMGTWKGPKFVSDYFWSNGNINVFSTNEATYFKGESGNFELCLMTRDYAEFKLGKTDLYVHPEFQVFSDGTFAGLAGLGYQLPIKCISIMPVILYRYDNMPTGLVGEDERVIRGGHQVHFELNTSGDWWRIHYEGYVDLWGMKTFNAATEQKVFFKITENFQLGVDFLYDDYNKFLVLGALRIAL